MRGSIALLADASGVKDRLLTYFKGETYQARAFRGTLLSVGNLAAANILRLGSNLVLTRLLFPEAFGLMALVSIVLAAAAMFSDLGLRGTVFQDERGMDPSFLNTIWTLQILRGLGIGAAIFLFAEPLARFYEEPLLADLLRISAVLPVIQGFNAIQMLSLNRELQIGRLVVLNLASQVIGIIAMISLALGLGTVWALLLGSSFGTLSAMVISHVILGGHRNRLEWDKSAVMSALGFGKFIFLASIAGFLIRQGDRAVLGKFVSLDDLAFYNIAFFLAMVPFLVSQAISDRVIYPLYARRPPAESARNRRKIAKARRLLTGGLIAAAVSIAFVGIAAIDLLYDSRYQSSGPLLVLIALASLPVLIIESYIKLPLASGQSGRFAVFQVLRAIVQIGLLLVLVPSFGILGAIVAPGLGTLIVYPLLLWTIRPFHGWDWVHDLVYGVLSLMAGGGVLWIHWAAVSPLFVRL